MTTDNTPFRILHLASSERWTGVADPIVSLACEQQKAGHVVWLGCIPGQSFERKAAARGLRVVQQFHLDRRLHPKHFWEDFWNIRRFVRQASVDVIHAHLLNDNWLAALALLTLGEPPLLVRTFHRWEMPRTDPFHRWLFAQRNDLTIATSRSLLSLFDGRVRLPEGAGRVIYGGVDYEVFHPDRSGAAFRREFEIPPDAPVVGIVARLSPGRGHDWLLDATPAILERMPEARIIIAGRGARKRTLRQRIAAAGLDRRVLMAGYRRHDLPETYAALEVALFLGMGSEGTCRAALEAMATGRPVIAPRAAAMPEIIDNGATGLLVAPNDPRALADAILRLLADRQERERMGRAARQAVVARFNERRRAELTLAAYREALDRKRSQ